MSTLVEVAANLVASQMTKITMSTDQIISEINKVYAGLKILESGQQCNVENDAKPSISIKDAFLKNEIVCMECGKRGFKALRRHLNTVHGMKPTDYRKKFGIASKQPLTARNYSQSRRKSALKLGLGENLAKARETRKANIEAENAEVVVAEAVNAD